MQLIDADAEGCFFRLVEEVLYQPVPLEVPQERSITSCGLACMNHQKCLFMSISEKLCVLSEEMGRNKYDGTQDERKFTIYKKVYLILEIYTLKRKEKKWNILPGRGAFISLPSIVCLLSNVFMIIEVRYVWKYKVRKSTKNVFYEDIEALLMNQTKGDRRWVAGDGRIDGRQMLNNQDIKT